MRLTLRAAWLNLDLRLGPEAGYVEESQFISLGSADLTPAPVEEVYWEEEEEGSARGFGFGLHT